ncbi:YraN family protein [Flavobacteriaceae bacterium 3-367]|uniref:YraN family protein n=1 Tax=Eudoraea algarum TaxID=3417568 RepID=UPI0032747E18
MGKHNEFGKKGEELAVRFLTEKGYLIKCTNYRYLKAEIDIIAEKGDILAVVEVKSRSSTLFEHIAETVTKAKIKRLVMAADYYVLTHDLDREVRFDIITIRKDKGSFEIEHLENAFYHF